VGGKRLYQLARSGKTVEIPVRKVLVEQIEIQGWYRGEYPELDLEISCGPGTYIRAIARDLGDILDVGATLAALTRTSSCGFDLDNSLTLETIETQLQQNQFHLISPLIPLQHLEKIELTPELSQNWLQGQKIPLNSRDISRNSCVVVTNLEQELLGIGTLIEEDSYSLLKPKIVM